MFFASTPHLPQSSAESSTKRVVKLGHSIPSIIRLVLGGVALLLCLRVCLSVLGTLERRPNWRQQNCSEKGFLRFSLDFRRFSLGRCASRLTDSRQTQQQSKQPAHLTRSLHGTCVEGAPAEARAYFPAALHRRGSVLQDHFKLVRVRTCSRLLSAASLKYSSGQVPVPAATTCTLLQSCTMVVAPARRTFGVDYVLRICARVQLSYLKTNTGRGQYRNIDP